MEVSLKILTHVSIVLYLENTIVRNRKGAEPISPAAHTSGSARKLFFLNRRADSEPTPTPMNPAKHVMIPNLRPTLHEKRKLQSFSVQYHSQIFSIIFV